MVDNKKLERVISILESALAQMTALDQEVRYPVKAAKAKVAARPDRNARKWKVDASRRGRVPTWVLRMTGTETKADLVKKFGNGFKFVEGVTPEIGA